jgi:hypothetical protein
MLSIVDRWLDMDTLAQDRETHSRARFNANAYRRQSFRAWTDYDGIDANGIEQRGSRLHTRISRFDLTRFVPGYGDAGWHHRMAVQTTEDGSRFTFDKPVR